MSTTYDTDAVHARAIRAFVVVALIVPAILVVLGVAVQLLLLPQVPETIAVHWNSAGEPDGFAPAWTQLVFTIVFGLGVPLLITLPTLPSLRRGGRGASYRFMGAMASATSVVVTVAFTWTFAAQAGLSEGSQAPSVWAAMIGALIAGIAVGVGAWFAQPAETWVRGTQAAATALPLGAGEKAVWLRTTSIVPAAAIAMGIGVVVLGFATSISWVNGAEPAVVWILAGTAVVLLAAAATSVAFHVRVDDTGLRVDSILGFPRFRVALADIASVSTGVINPMGEFGGWGLRWRAGRRFGVVLRRGEAIEVTRTNGKRFVVTVDDADTGARLLEAMVQWERPHIS